MDVNEYDYEAAQDAVEGYAIRPLIKFDFGLQVTENGEYTGCNLGEEVIIRINDIDNLKDQKPLQ